MSKVKVKREKLAERCEICHQKDCFDAGKNYCYRCEKIGGVEFNKNRKISNRLENLIPTLQKIEFHIRQDDRFSLSNNFDKFSWKILVLYLMEIYVYPLFRASLVAEVLVYLFSAIAVVFIGYIALSNPVILIVFIVAIYVLMVYLLGYTTNDSKINYENSYSDKSDKDISEDR